MAKKAKLRFAALRRVSEPKQEKKGESLRTQTTDITNAVKQFDGEIVEWYGGQEHGTAGYEKKEIDRLLKDAKKKPRPFDAFIVAHADRWSRDNEKNKEGLGVFSGNDIRFFVGVTEYSLFDPAHLLFLELSATIGAFYARNQKFKSISNRIHRARRGIPTCGKLPFGRTFDKDTGKWGVDKDKKKIAENAAERYLARESMADIAASYGINHASFHKTMTTRCGTIWEQHFVAKEFNIDVTVPTIVPELLSEGVIKKMHKQAAANKTFHHGHLTHSYLLNRMVLCAHCGKAMGAETYHADTARERQYYRHPVKKRFTPSEERQTPCAFTGVVIQAAVLEQNVLKKLVDAFGNRAAIQRAIDAATPNIEKARELAGQLKRLDDELQKVSSGITKVLKLITDEKINDSDANSWLTDLKARQARLEKQCENLRAQINNAPSREAVADLAQAVTDKIKLLSPTKRFLLNNAAIAKMDPKDRRALVESVFAGNMPDGKRMGVYITFESPRRKPSRKKVVGVAADRTWRYRLLGNLITENGLIPFTSQYLHDDGVPAVSTRNGQTKSALH